jgi:single-stranded DNA-binding protein
MAKQTKKTVTLFGNLGADPRLHQIPARTETRNVYDPIIDDVVERNFDREAQEFRTFSLAVKNQDQEETRWIHCIDWKGNTAIFRKGDRVRVTGYFQVRAYKKDGEDKRIRQFVVETANLERPKIRQEAAA